MKDFLRRTRWGHLRGLWSFVPQSDSRNVRSIRSYTVLEVLGGGRSLHTDLLLLPRVVLTVIYSSPSLLSLQSVQTFTSSLKFTDKRKKSTRSSTNLTTCNQNLNKTQIIGRENLFIIQNGDDDNNHLWVRPHRKDTHLTILWSGRTKYFIRENQIFHNDRGRLSVE